MGLTLLFFKLLGAITVMFLDLSAFFVLAQLLVPNPANQWIRAIQQAGLALVNQWQGVFEKLWRLIGVRASEKLSLAMSLLFLVLMRGVIELLTFGLRGN